MRDTFNFFTSKCFWSINSWQWARLSFEFCLLLLLWIWGGKWSEYVEKFVIALQMQEITAKFNS